MKGAAMETEKRNWKGISVGRSVVRPIPPQPLTIKMRGTSLDRAWITSETSAGVAENWGSLGGPWNRSEGALPLAAPRPSTCPLSPAAARHPPQIQCL